MMLARMAGQTEASGSGETILNAAAALRQPLQVCAAEIERERALPAAIVARLRDVGLYRMLVPAALGGAEVDLCTFLRAVELVAEGDGSAGWNLAGSGVAMSVVLALPAAGVSEVLGRGPDVIVNGTTGQAAAGCARAVPGGYVVDSTWEFGTGIQESDWMIGACRVYDGDELRCNSDGSPVLRRVVVPARDCTVRDTWDTSGLRGTGSHHWGLNKVFVPEHRTQSPEVDWSRRPGTLYRTPRHALSGPHFSAVATGIARAAITGLTELAGAKTPHHDTWLLRERADTQAWLGRAEALLESARSYRTAVEAEVWQTVAAGGTASVTQQARCRLAATHAVESSIQAVDLMYRAAGTTAIARHDRIGRCWRDVHTVGQAVNVAPEYYEIAGRALLGLDPGPKLG